MPSKMKNYSQSGSGESNKSLLFISCCNHYAIICLNISLDQLKLFSLSPVSPHTEVKIIRVQFHVLNFYTDHLVISIPILTVAFSTCFV